MTVDFDKPLWGISVQYRAPYKDPLGLNKADWVVQTYALYVLATDEAGAILGAMIELPAAVADNIIGRPSATRFDVGRSTKVAAQIVNDRRAPSGRVTLRTS